MSWQPAVEADCAQTESCAPVAVVITPKAKDIGGFEVRRALPSIERRSIGPFVFFDQMGPATFAAGTGIDVRPHPHIGLSTLTWLVEGEIMHRDSLGSEQPIRPGEVNWMTAGRGIVHSERTPDHKRDAPHSLFGLQVWLALPQAHEETEPTFQHYKSNEIPRIEQDGVVIQLVAGEAWGERSPVEVFSETLYADIALPAGGRFALPTETPERGLYIMQGEVSLAGETFSAGSMLALNPGREAVVEAAQAARVALIGGAPLDGRRHLWWNFVSSSKERLEQAKADWKEGRFPAVPGETEFIPLPE